MSFILDALRKSENERQRNTTPGIADTPVRQRSNKRSMWLPIVAVLLGINLSLVAILWFLKDDSNAPVPETAAVAQVETPTVAPEPVATPVDAYTRPVADPNVSRELTTELEPEPEAPKPASQAKPPAATKPVAAIPTPPPVPVDDNLVDVPTYAELTLSGAVSLPPMHLDIHVYSDTANERFVFINTSKYREGETTTEGPVVDGISPLGVILRHQNRRFLLTRE